MKEIPLDWLCVACGKESASAATFRPLSCMLLDERMTLGDYGQDEGQFFDGEEIALCDCGHSHWKPPLPQNKPII